MIAQLKTATILGIDAIPVDVEVDITNGLPAVTIVGLPDTAVQEARERIRAALHNAGFAFPKTRVTINLAPADVKKEGTSFDVPIALGILIASNVLQPEHVRNIMAFGELALHGGIRGVRGGLLFGLCAKKENLDLLAPSASSAQAASVIGAHVFAFEHIRDLVMHLKKIKTIPSCKPLLTSENATENPDDDLQYIIGQEHAKKSLIIAAAGGHSLLFAGPPGTGKTMLARCLPGLLPPMSHDDQIEVTKIWSAAGAIDVDSHIVTQRPFRAPHHSASAVSLVGGGSAALPGEISLAHKGVLFLDECTEFPRSVLNMLRQPLENGTIAVTRAERRVVYPASFQLIASTNPCPCGNAGSLELVCSCSVNERLKYQKRLTGPLLDRIDMVVQVPREPFSRVGVSAGLHSAQAREVVTKTRALQLERQGRLNAHIPRNRMQQVCVLTEQAEALLQQMVNKHHLSRRAADCMLRVGRTLADLEGQEIISDTHIAESSMYRVSQEEIFV